jgi:hypothetical protein
VGRSSPAAYFWARGEEAQEHAVNGVFLRRPRSDEPAWGAGHGPGAPALRSHLILPPPLPVPRTVGYRQPKEFGETRVGVPVWFAEEGRPWGMSLGRDAEAHFPRLAVVYQP